MKQNIVLYKAENIQTQLHTTNAEIDQHIVSEHAEHPATSLQPRSNCGENCHCNYYQHG